MPDSKKLSFEGHLTIATKDATIIRMTYQIALFSDTHYGEFQRWIPPALTGVRRDCRGR